MIERIKMIMFQKEINKIIKNQIKIWKNNRNIYNIKKDNLLKLKLIHFLF